MKQSYIISLLLMLTLTFNVMSGQTAAKESVVTLPSTEMTIDDLFKAIHAQTGMSVVYNVKDVQLLKKVKVPSGSNTVSEILREVLNPKMVSYTIKDNAIIITKTGAQVSGKVFDKATGEPLVGATVYNKDNHTGASTDINGDFLINAKKGAKLTFSYIGYKPVDIKVGNAESLNVGLESTEHALEDVVVTGYKIVDKRASTSAITSIKAEDILRPDALSIDQMLEGQVPDLMYMSNSGESGSAPKIRIRGTSSIIGNREPLWVVDGIVVKDPVPISPDELNDPDYINRLGNAISGLNPQDIERLDVLKDA